VTPIVLPRPQESFAACGSRRVFKSRFCFAKVGGFRLANGSKRHNGNTKYEEFHRRQSKPVNQNSRKCPKFPARNSYLKRTLIVGFVFFFVTSRTITRLAALCATKS
jgi:hypothetical protein